MRHKCHSRSATIRNQQPSIKKGFITAAFRAGLATIDNKCGRSMWVTTHTIFECSRRFGSSFVSLILQASKQARRLKAEQRLARMENALGYRA